MSVRQKALALFQDRPGYEAHVRECARRLGHSAGAVGRVLRALEADGLLASRWIGRSLVYRLIPPRPLGPRPAGDTRPYFLWDLEITWDEFRQMLHSSDTAVRRWALERLLNDARWADIWSLVTPDGLRKDLPFLRVRFKEVYLEVVGGAARR